MRFQGMSGNYPLSLLQSALHTQHGLAAGRFRYYSMKDGSSGEDPLVEIERVSTSLIVGARSGEKWRVNNGKHVALLTRGCAPDEKVSG